jgi:hypothetical protein
MEAHHQPVYKSKSGAALKERCSMRTAIEGVVPEAPGLQGRSRNLELFGGLTFGEALDSQLPVRLKEVRAFEAIPAWLALRVALLLVLDDGSHSDLLWQSLAFE